MMLCTLRRTSILIALPIFVLVCSLCMLTVNSAQAQPRGGESQTGPASPPPLPKTPLLPLKNEFFVVSDQDRQTIVSLVVADELSKFFAERGRELKLKDEEIPWVIPQPSWSATQVTDECAANPNALGGVVLTYYSGVASHFWLLWQTQTTTFEIFAQIIACNRTAGKAEPKVVGIIAHLAGANDTPWVVRRSQISIPLLSIAAIGTVISKQPASSNSKSSTLTLTAVAGSLFSSAGSKDVPGYSDPLRLRLSSQHIGVDVATTLRQLCGVGDIPPGGVPFNAVPDARPRTQLCQDLGVSPRS